MIIEMMTGAINSLNGLLPVKIWGAIWMSGEPLPSIPDVVRHEDWPLSQSSKHKGIHFPCYIRIPKESGHGWEQRIKGWEHVWLIAIDYHAATGTAGMGYKEDRRSKAARWPESGTDSGGLTGGTRTRDLGQSKRGQKGVDISNVDSGELWVQSTRLKYNEGRTGKIQMKHKSEGSLREI